MMRKFIFIIMMFLSCAVAYGKDYVDGDFSFIDDISYSKIETSDSVINVMYVTSDGEICSRTFLITDEWSGIFVASRMFVIQASKNCCIEIEVSDAVIDDKSKNTDK